MTSTPSITPSITVQYAQGLCQAAERLGLSLPPAWPSKLPSRVPLAQQDALWQHLAAQSSEPLLGLQLGHALHIGHLDLVGVLLMSCDSLGEALEALLEYYPIIGEGGEFSLQHEGERCVLSYQPCYTVLVEQRVEAVLASLINMTRWISGGRELDLHVQFAHPALAADNAYQHVLACPVKFSATSNALSLPRAVLSQALIQANPAMCSHLRQLADQQLDALGNSSLSAQVTQLLNEFPAWGKERVAERLAVSGRHLNRKLAEEGASFKLLREQVLSRLAEQGLRDGRSIQQLAEQLGFADESAFSKAFRRWCGVTPGQFRQR